MSRQAQLELPRIPVNAAEFGARLREIREAKGWTQDVAADILGWTQYALSRLETGARRAKWPEDVLRICERYQVSVNELLRDPKQLYPPRGRGAHKADDDDD